MSARARSVGVGLRADKKKAIMTASDSSHAPGACGKRQLIRARRTYLDEETITSGSRLVGNLCPNCYTIADDGCQVAADNGIASRRLLSRGARMLLDFVCIFSRLLSIKLVI
jgi:hypothetical protein